MIRVLVAEDSETSCALLGAILTQDSAIEIIGHARNGAEAIAMARELKPDLITMDLSMPGIDGFAATEQIMTATPVPIVVVSAFPNLTEAEAAARALSCGALTVMHKPPGLSAPEYPASARNLIETVKAMAEVKVVRRISASRTKVVSSLAVRPRSRPSLLAIAASIGGPQALQTLLAGLGQSFPIPILIVQHIANGFIGELVKWLSASLPLVIKLAEPTEPLLPGLVYFAPDDCHLGVGFDFRVILSTAAPINGFRPSANFLFESAARAGGSRTVAAILTGMGDDGLEGLRAVKRQNGYIIAQDEDTSVVFGMPGTAIKAGIVDDVLPLSTIAQKLRQLVKVNSPSEL